MAPAPRDSTAAATTAEPASQEVRRRRRRRSRERVRVTRACDQCKRQKIRCTGSLPCEVCTRKGNLCSYNAVYSRGRAPSVALDESIAASHAVPQGLVEEQPSVSSRRDVRSEPVSSPSSPESLQTDRQGHYVGPASGVSFLLRVQRRVHQAFPHPQSSSIFTFGDAPLPEFDASFFVLPQKEDTRGLLERYFNFAVPTHRFLHQPTVEAWFDELYATSGSMGQQDESPARIAVLFMVFAQASLYAPAAGDGPAVDSDASARFFLAAEHQLQKERGQVRLASVQARLAQCFYLLSQSRINHAWSLFGTTAHLALAIGLNRRRPRASAAADRVVEAECRRRVFWCAYALDKYLAAALGRPRAIREEDADQELPSCVDDADLAAEEEPAAAAAARGQPVGWCGRRGGQPLMRAAVAHVKLSRIVDQVLRDLYPIRPLTTPVRLRMADRCSGALRDWHREQEDFLDPGGTSAALFLPIYQRQRSALNLAYWHARILTHRSFLLGKFGMGTGTGTGTGTSVDDSPGRVTSRDQQVETHVRECLRAAVNICDVVDELVKTKKMFKGFWFTIYYAFCAVAVLYVHAIQHDSSGDYAKHLALAIKCHTQISTMAEEHSLASRYCKVLEELKKEALQDSPETSCIPSCPTFDRAGAASRQPCENDGTEPQRCLVDEQAPLLDENHHMTAAEETAALDISPESFHDISGWGIFDSMASFHVPNPMGNLAVELILSQATSGFVNFEGFTNDGYL